MATWSKERMGLVACGLGLCVTTYWAYSAQAELSESEAAYERLADEAKVALTKVREECSTRIDQAEQRGRSAADEAMTRARKDRRTDGEAKGKTSKKKRKTKKHEEDKVPGVGFVNRLYDAADAAAASQAWDDVTYDRVTEAFDLAFDAIDVVATDLEAGLAWEDAKTRVGAIRQELLATLDATLGTAVLDEMRLAAKEAN